MLWESKFWCSKSRSAKVVTDQDFVSKVKRVTKSGEQLKFDNEVKEFSEDNGVKTRSMTKDLRSDRTESAITFRYWNGTKSFDKFDQIPSFSNIFDIVGLGFFFGATEEIKMKDNLVRWEPTAIFSPKINYRTKLCNGNKIKL